MVNRALDNHKNYLRNVLLVPQADEARYLEVMQNYSESWWLSRDSVKIAKYQMNESVLLVPFIELQNALETVLKRYVAPSEISYSNEALRAEVNAAVA